MNIRFHILAIALMAGTLAQQPAAAQNQPNNGGDQRTRARRDIITRYIVATNNLTERLAKLNEESAQADVRQRLENAVQRLIEIRTALKSDRMENSPQVQELLKEKHAEIAEASGKLATQVSRLMAMPEANKDLLALLGKI